MAALNSMKSVFVKSFSKFSKKSLFIFGSSKRNITTPTKASVEGYNSYAKEFRKTWPTIMDRYMSRFPEYLEDMEKTIGDQETAQHFMKCTQYCVEGAKMTKVLYPMGTWKILKDNNILIDEESALKLTFISELFNTVQVLFDDLSENTEHRRGRLCWYRNPGVGMKAINDYSVMNSCARVLLTKYFKDHQAYHALQDIFITANQAFIVGQSMEDHYLAGTRPWHEFIPEHYRAKSLLKTATVAFIPRCIGMLHLAGVGYTEDQQKIIDVLLEIGYLYQIQNDYFDLYYKVSDTGKKAPIEDIPTGKFSWFFCTALQLASEDQKKIIMENYGKQDVDKVNNVLKVYEDLNLKEEYNKFERQHINLVIDKINQVDSLPVEFFYTAMSVIFSWINPSVDLK